jgi:hypothetical protein
VNRLLWFVLGLFVGEFWSGWLMHIVYVGVILALLWTGHNPFLCK